MKNRFICTILLIIISSVGLSQNLNYEILRKGEVVGKLSVEILTGEKIKAYKIESNTLLPFNNTYKYSLISIYEKKELTSSSVISFVNDNEHRRVITSRDGNNYSISENGSETTFKDEITYSEALIYTEEPMHRKEMYSEFLGKTKSIKSIGENQYQLTNIESGNISIYKYKNGVLQEAEIDFGLFSFSLKRL